MKFPGLLTIAYKLYFNTFHDMNYAESVHLMLSTERQLQLSRNFSGEEGLVRYTATVWDTANGTLYDSITTEYHHRTSLRVPYQ